MGSQYILKNLVSPPGIFEATEVRNLHHLRLNPLCLQSLGCLFVGHLYLSISVIQVGQVTSDLAPPYH